MTNDKDGQVPPEAITNANLHARIAALEATQRELEVEVDAEPDWNDYEEEEPDDRDDQRVLKRMWDALPDGHCLFWAYDDDDNLLTRTIVGDDDDDEDGDEDGV